jgi:opacity protein-like surface antigen
MGQYCYAEKEFNLKIGADMAGKRAVTFKQTYESDVNTGISLTGECIGFGENNVGFGAGITYQTSRTIKTNYGEGAGFNYIPLFGIIKARLTKNQIVPYFIGHLGYNFILEENNSGGSRQNGLYYGAGAGLDLSNSMIIEILYSINNSKESSSKIEYTAVRINVGYRFAMHSILRSQTGSIIYCPWCGEKNVEAGKYCVKCGKELKK